MRLRTVVLCTLVVCLPAVAAEKSPMKAGKWEVTVKMEMPGMDMKPVTVTKCITEEEAAKPATPDVQGGDCKITDYRMDGKNVTWSFKCEKQNLTGDGKMTFGDNSYEGESKMKMGEMEMSSKYSGKYLGNCD